VPECRRGGRARRIGTGLAVRAGPSHIVNAKSHVGGFTRAGRALARLMLRVHLIRIASNLNQY
jgi:hypothetical protein